MNRGVISLWGNLIAGDVSQRFCPGYSASGKEGKGRFSGSLRLPWCLTRACIFGARGVISKAIQGGCSSGMEQWWSSGCGKWKNKGAGGWQRLDGVGYG